MRSSAALIVDWSFSMKSEQFAEHQRLQQVQFVVAGEHALGERHVAADVGVERVAQHFLRDERHARNVDELLDRRMLQVAGGRLGDVHGQVAHALEVAVDLDRRHDGAQVGRHRLLERQQLEAAVVDLDVELIDVAVAGQHLLEQAEVALDQAADGQRRRSSARPPISRSRVLSWPRSSSKCRGCRSIVIATSL